jgi:hypothetical protein
VHANVVTGLKVLELAKDAPRLFAAQNPVEQARLLKTLFQTAPSIAEVLQLLR